MELQEFFKKTHLVKYLSGGHKFQLIRPRIFCKDGVSLSVQGSESHYSSPRENYPPYYKVEVGYPSIRPPETWREYFDGEWMDLGFFGTMKHVYEKINSAFWAYKNIGKSHAVRTLKTALKDNATDSVYGYVPVDLVEEFIKQHGGIDEVKTFENWPPAS